MTVRYMGDEYESQEAILLDVTRDADDPSKLTPYLRGWLFHNTAPDALAEWVLRHPFVYSVLGPLFPHHCNKLAAKKWEAMKSSWREKDWYFVIFLHERPYRMGLLEKLFATGRISVDELRPLLLDWWVDTEIPEGNQEEPLTLFRAAGFSTDDQEGFDALPSLLTLYRGVDGVCELTPHGPSWTTDLKVANFFAVRYAKGTTYKFQIEKNHPAVLAWISGREEHEIILDFDKLNKDDIQIEEDFSNGAS